MPETTTGDLLDGLGVTAEMEDGDLVPTALVLLKVIGEDGQVGLTVACSEGMSWLDQLGLLEGAKQIVAVNGYEAGDG